MKLTSAEYERKIRDLVQRAAFLGWTPEKWAAALIAQQEEIARLNAIISKKAMDRNKREKAVRRGRTG